MDNLYRKAVFMAIREGRVNRMSDVSEKKSGREGRYLVLRDHEDKTIAKEFAVRIDNTEVPTSFETSQDKAIAWSYTMGYGYPQKMNGCLEVFLVIVGLFTFIVPGVLLIIWLVVKNNQYERDVAALVSKWIDAGRPEPGEGIKQETPLVRIEGSMGTPVAALSTEERLEELHSMKEKGFINDEEYETLRKKALGL